ncbi:ArsR/SmtB family transcription factor [Plantactinospora sonchi]|uniref:Winged helix-turn-helix domain-containing protein n=1 Tax=Plantactinospora sonchi TaxID=1544735 RepID=A0ABU7RVN0_9ACTN
MGVWRIGADVLARSSFAVSPLIETVAALKQLGGHPTLPGQRAWVTAQLPAYRARLAADPFTAAFVKAAFPPRWLPDFLSTPPTDVDGTFRGELERVRATPPEVARADLATGLRGAALPPELCGPDLSDRAAELLAWVWTRTIEPDWPRRQRLFQADIVSRTQRLSSGGWAATLDGMRPGMRWLGGGQLQINTYDHPPQDVSGAPLFFIPSTSPRGWVGSDAPFRHTVVYPCSGILAEPVRRTPPRALTRLLGPVRADILTRLESPRSPTQLVALTGYGLGSVGGHLRVLLDARLVQRRRSGRYVLYYRTEDGDRLVALQRPGRHTGQEGALPVQETIGRAPSLHLSRGVR